MNARDYRGKFAAGVDEHVICGVAFIDFLQTPLQHHFALINEHDLAVKRNQYIETASAASWWADRVTEARVALQGVGAGMAPSLVGQDVQTIARLIDERLCAICENLARKVEDALTDEPTQEAE